jgi:hypothetical protein
MIRQPAEFHPASICRGRKTKKARYNYKLFSFTESELLEKLRKGEITPDEYNHEMSSRDPDFSEKENSGPL